MKNFKWEVEGKKDLTKTKKGTVDERLKMKEEKNVKDFCS